MTVTTRIMTREEYISLAEDALAGAPPTTPKTIRAALAACLLFLKAQSDQATQPPAAHLQSANDTGEGMAAPPGFLTLARQCAAELEEAAALTVGVMDSDSKAYAVNSQRLGAMQAVATRLREVA